MSCVGEGGREVEGTTRRGGQVRALGVPEEESPDSMAVNNLM